MEQPSEAMGSCRKGPIKTKGTAHAQAAPRRVRANSHDGTDSGVICRVRSRAGRPGSISVRGAAEGEGAAWAAGICPR